MRKREEIEEEYEEGLRDINEAKISKEMKANSAMCQNAHLQLEVLLDIRDLLEEQLGPQRDDKRREFAKMQKEAALCLFPLL